MAVTGSAEHVDMFTCVQTRVSKFLTTWLSVSSSSASSGFLELMKKKTVLLQSVKTVSCCYRRCFKLHIILKNFLFIIDSESSWRTTTS